MTTHWSDQTAEEREARAAKHAAALMFRCLTDAAPVECRHAEDEEWARKARSMAERSLALTYPGFSDVSTDD